MSRSFKMTGRSYDAIDSILISHLHMDHLGGLFMLLQGFWLEKRRKPLVIYMPAEGIGAVRALLRAGYLYEELFPFPLSFLALEAGRKLSFGATTVTAFPTTHLETLRDLFGAKYPASYEAFCFLFEAGPTRIGHSADIGRASDLDPLLQKPLQLLVCELAHVEPREMFEYLQERAIEHIVFTHLARPFWEQLDGMKDLAEKILRDRRVTFLRDQQELLASG